MTKTILFCVLVLSFNLVLCNGFSFKDIGDTIRKISSEFEGSESEMQSDEGKKSDDTNGDVCPDKCLKEITELKKNMTELYMALLALHAEMAHMSQHISHHDKALKHIAIWGHKYSRYHSNESDDSSQNTNQASRKCNKCRKNSSDEDDDDGGVKIHKHRDRHDGHDEHDSHHHSNFGNDSKQKVDNQKKKNDSSEESSEEQDSSTTKPPSDLGVSNGDDGNLSNTVQNSESKTQSIHGISQPAQSQSSDDEFKVWYDRMLSDIHGWSHHKSLRATVNQSQIHMHHVHINSNTQTDSQKANEDKLEEMEKAMSSEELIFATCNVRPNRHIALLNQQDVRGRINLWQQKSNRGPVHMHVKLKGFEVSSHEHRPPTRQVRETNLMPVEQEPEERSPAQRKAQRTADYHSHGFHVHESGDLTRDCQSVGAHYNPLNLAHGGPYDVIRHVGDLGNIRCDANGETDVELTFSQISLSGEHSIINRSIVIHKNIDDYGRNPENPTSLTTGNSGVRIACCVIEEVKSLPEDSDSQSKVGAVAGPASSNKQRREVSMRNRYEGSKLSELFEKLAQYESRHQHQSLFERTPRKYPKYSRE